MDPAVQVALVSVFTALVTTLGVVAVAVINKRSNVKPDDPDMDLDANELLERLFAMAAENQRKEATIQKLKAQISEYKRRLSYLESLVNIDKKGHTDERAAWRPRGSGTNPEQEPDLE